jgi:hypothetical protein
MGVLLGPIEQTNHCASPISQNTAPPITSTEHSRALLVPKPPPRFPGCDPAAIRAIGGKALRTCHLQTDRIVFPTASAHPDILLPHSGLPGEMLDWLRQYFLAAVAAGNRIAPGEHIQVGWMLVEARSEADGGLALWEPDFTAMPIVWTRGVDRTAWALAQQLAV